MFENYTFSENLNVKGDEHGIKTSDGIARDFA
jgi:hypothetical protein